MSQLNAQLNAKFRLLSQDVALVVARGSHKTEVQLVVDVMSAARRRSVPMTRDGAVKLVRQYRKPRR